MTRYPPVEDLVPHAPPALALDALVEGRDGFAHTRVTVRDGGLLVQNGGIDSVVTLEWMAQTVAACLGYAAFLGGVGVRVGMVVACRQFTIARPRLHVGERCDVRVQRLRGTDDISNFEGEVRDAHGALVASATMTLVHTAAPPE
jgi:predicted hotdog family 3-hydroxylacyl-ACP dehydratase